MNKNLLKFISKRIRAFSHIDPERDWIILLTSAALLMSIIVVGNIWAFDTVATGGVIGSSKMTPPPAFSQTSLDTVRAIFAGRATEEGKYVLGAYRYVDPSL